MVSGAVNLDPAWEHLHLTKALNKLFGKKPVRAANDADVQGFVAISGRGVELVLTLRTGVGSSLLRGRQTCAERGSREKQTSEVGT